MNYTTAYWWKIKVDVIKCQEWIQRPIRQWLSIDCFDNLRLTLSQLQGKILIRKCIAFFFHYVKNILVSKSVCLFCSTFITASKKCSWIPVWVDPIPYTFLRAIQSIELDVMINKRSPSLSKIVHITQRSRGVS